MNRTQPGELWQVSRLTISAGVITSLWGETPEEEGRATLEEALSLGVNHIDTAPAYRNGEAERFLGRFFAAGWPSEVRVTTKVSLGTIASDKVKERMRSSLIESLKNINRSDVDLFLLHSHLVPDGWERFRHNDKERIARSTTPVSLYRESVVPAMQELVSEGLCSAWGITGIGPVEGVEAALDADISDRPAAVQCIINALESAGGLDYADPLQDARLRRRLVHEAGVGMLGIRLMQAGALSSAMDRAPRGNDAQDFQDFERAAGFRRLASDLGVTPSMLAYRYAFSDARVHSHVLGVKNRTELSEAVQGIEMGPLSNDILEKIDALRT